MAKENQQKLTFFQNKSIILLNKLSFLVNYDIFNKY